MGRKRLLLKPHTVLRPIRPVDFGWEFPTITPLLTHP